MSSPKRILVRQEKAISFTCKFLVINNILLSTDILSSSLPLSNEPIPFPSTVDLRFLMITASLLFLKSKKTFSFFVPLLSKRTIFPTLDLPTVNIKWPVPVIPLAWCNKLKFPNWIELVKFSALCKWGQWRIWGSWQSPPRRVYQTHGWTTFWALVVTFSFFRKSSKVSNERSLIQGPHFEEQPDYETK